jgi:hypothetical protein
MNEIFQEPFPASGHNAISYFLFIFQFKNEITGHVIEVIVKRKQH